MDDFIRLLTLRDANTRVVLLGTAMLGVAAAVIGAFAVQRKRSLVGDAVAHAALPGVCTAYFIVGERHFGAFLFGASVFGVLAAAFVACVKRFTRVKEDAAIALAIGGFFGIGIVLSRIVQNQPEGNRAGLDGFIFGKAASMVSADAATILAVAAGVLLVVALLFKELSLLCFDRDFASGQGWPTFGLDLVLMGLVCACTVVGLPAVGVVLMVALLVIPPVAARFWTSSMRSLVVLSGALGGLSGLVGTALSATIPAPADAMTRGWPTGPLIVLVAAAMFGVSLLLAPKRGLFADLARRVSLRRKIALQNLLRDVYEFLEPLGDLRASWLLTDVARGRDSRGAVLRRAIRSGFVVPASAGYSLTAEGQRAASRVIRAHRLWELYLIEHADIASAYVDRDADQIEHVLPAGVIEQLEARLAASPRKPDHQSAGQVPPSPHPIAPRSVRGRGGATLGMLLAVGALVSLGVSRATVAAVVADPGRAGAADAAWFRIGSYEVRSDDLWTVGTAVLCSVACALVGCFLVLRRLSLLGDAISHAILPGLAGAFLLTHSRDPTAMLAGAIAVGALTALMTAGLHRWGRVHEDAAMGVVFTTLFAIGVILVTLAARGVDLDPGCVLYGLIEFVPFDVVSVGGADVPRAFLWLAGVLAVNVTLIVLFFKELRAAAFDPVLATAMGFNATLIHFGLVTLVAATSVASFEAVGSILVVAMLVAPGATAHLLTDRLSSMLWCSAVIAAGSAVCGYGLAVWLNTSVAGSIASVALLVFVLTAVFAPTHGALARVLSPSDARRRDAPP